ncbi:MAG: hypothetical protein WA191_07185 [Telluria sp.]
MSNRDLKDWTMDELLTHATWTVMEHIIKGELSNGVYSAINLALRWKAAKEQA